MLHRYPRAILVNHCIMLGVCKAAPTLVVVSTTFAAVAKAATLATSQCVRLLKIRGLRLHANIHLRALGKRLQSTMFAFLERRRSFDGIRCLPRTVILLKKLMRFRPNDFLFTNTNNATVMFNFNELFVAFRRAPNFLY